MEYSGGFRPVKEKREFSKIRMDIFKTLATGWSIVWAASVVSLFIDIPYAYHAFEQNEETVLLLLPFYVFGVWIAGLLIISFFLWIIRLFTR